MQTPTDLVARAHARDLQVNFSIIVVNLYAWRAELQFVHGNFKMQVHPYTYRNENLFLHFDFHQDPYQEYDYWLNKIGVDGLFTDFTGSVHLYQEWASPLSKDKGDDDDEAKASKLLHKIKLLLAS